MYFIYTILLFGITSISSFFISRNVTEGDWPLFFMGVTIITGLVTLICIGTMLFYNLNIVDYRKEKINSIKNHLKNKTNLQADIGRYKSELRKMLIEMYPEFEKDMFDKMTKSDSESLEMIMIKYPELKFDGVLMRYIKGLEGRLAEIYKCEKHVLDDIERFNNYNDTGWTIKKMTLPNDIAELEYGVSI